MASVKQVDCTEPKFLEKSKELVSSVRKLGTTGLMDFMDVSEKLAELNVQRFKEWKPPFSIANAKQALFAFTGDVYDGLDATTLQPRDIQFAQNHLRILSGLYGLLKPLDLIQPYRLEMGRPLKTNRARTLYEFWRGTITEELNRTKGDLLVNLASQEYFKAIDTRKLDKKIITPEFKDEKNGQFKTISFFAKKARGTMARFIIQHRIDSEEGIRAFTESGYAHNAELSKPGAPVFTRTQP